MDKYDIYKAGGILIKDRKLAVEKSFDKPIYSAPGGSIEKEETPIQALIRELKEEFSIDVKTEDLEYFGTFTSVVSYNNKTIKMEVYTVKKWEGRIIPDNEIKEVKWIDSKEAREIELGSIFAHHVIPMLKEKNIID